MKQNAVYQLAVAATVAAVFVTSAPLCASGADVPSPTNAPGLVGGSPSSCGYSWLPDRQGWLGPDGTAFVPAKDKPGWAAYVPANTADANVAPIVRPVEPAVARPVVPADTNNVSPIVRPVEPAVARPVVPLTAAEAEKTKPVVPPATGVHPVVPHGVGAPPAPVAK